MLLPRFSDGERRTTRALLHYRLLVLLPAATAGHRMVDFTTIKRSTRQLADASSGYRRRPAPQFTGAILLDADADLPVIGPRANAPARTPLHAIFS